MWISLLGFRSRSTGYAHPTIVALIIVTIVLVLAFGYGGVQAMNQLSEEGHNYVLKTKEGSRCIKLLRVGSEIILVQESDGHVSVVPDSEVELLRRTGDPLRNPRISIAQLRAWLLGGRQQRSVSKNLKPEVFDLRHCLSQASRRSAQEVICCARHPETRGSVSPLRAIIAS